MAETSDRPPIRVHPPVVVLADVLLGMVLKSVFPAQMTPRKMSRAARLAIGLPVLLGGLALGGAAVANMRRLGTTPDPHHPATALVTTGPYRFTRNPIYLGFTLLVLGIGILANSLWFIPLAGALMLTIQTQVIRYEESYLENRFGAPYRVYKERVRRWI